MDVLQLLVDCEITIDVFQSASPAVCPTCHCCRAPEIYSVRLRKLKFTVEDFFLIDREVLGCILNYNYDITKIINYFIASCIFCFNFTFDMLVFATLSKCKIVLT
ncbi:unnamed protein product [Clavelina lepadiformis]|uniref:Uncharacterized protein n=1 Tax=Clavelina lepadiformis TaxID=159417 RepID=A0ABP0GIZ3_CLALP